ncbi:MAG: amino acid adenylation domain-containing protein [Lachnospiraceae bacterium]|nr:amino acid adenylation domain-containing protein [Lachnospiraceae bacterium]
MQASITEWLDITAERYPDKTAIVDEWGKISFTMFRSKSHAVAWEIRKQNIGEQKPIVVFLEKSGRSVVSFLGVAYSRNFYCPIDIDMPALRVNKILEILQPAAAITTLKLYENFSKFDFHGPILFYENIEENSKNEENVMTLSRKIIDTDLLYVLFTSGSTGIPKGVGIRHRSVIDYIDWVTEEFSVDEKNSFGNQAPFYFDNSILDIYCMLKTGATMYIIPKSLFAQPVLLLKYLEKNHIDIIFWVPSALITIAKRKALKNIDLSKTLKTILFCGEVMPNKQLNYWREHLPDAIYANLYGPTEITDACAFYLVDRDFRDDAPLPIGRPMKNTEILLLDETDSLITPDQVGKIGELCVKGTSLAAGYYNNPKKTSEVFVQNPLQNGYEEKLYRTGDLAWYNEYGELMYSGRKDDQIKHMGHRIELGEIETAVSSFCEVHRCCCFYDELRQRIVLAVESDIEITKSEIRERLQQQIPEYMLPGEVLYISKLPLNSNGKIDRKKLKADMC